MLGRRRAAPKILQFPEILTNMKFRDPTPAERVKQLDMNHVVRL
jgi:hypothetical protein